MTEVEVRSLLGTPLVTEPARAGETWLYRDDADAPDPSNTFSLLGSATVVFNSQEYVERYFGASNVVRRGMSREEVTEVLGPPTESYATRDVKREFFSTPGSYGRYEARVLGFDSSGVVSGVYRYFTYD